MDFARKQLEKYGWTDGKGLGKHENGISEALKPKLKRSVTGIGHDPASEFNEHWWTALYDKAAGNIEVKEKNNKTKKIKATKEFEITNSTWKLKNDNGQSKEKYSGSFVRTAVLTSDGSKTENVRDPSEEECAIEKKDAFQMTDEELFRACEGRTAHKGARHGLKALGKLARIAQQEQTLLNQPQYNGYLKKITSTEDIVENISLENGEVVKIKKKKKRKRCFSGNAANVFKAEEINVACEQNVIENVKSDELVNADVVETAREVHNKLKRKGCLSDNIANACIVEENNVTSGENEVTTAKLNYILNVAEVVKDSNKQKKKRKKSVIDNVANDTATVIEESIEQEINVESFAGVNNTGKSKKQKTKDTTVDCKEVVNIDRPEKKNKRKHSVDIKDATLGEGIDRVIKKSSFVKKKKKKCK